MKKVIMGTSKNLTVILGAAKNAQLAAQNTEFFGQAFLRMTFFRHAVIVMILVVLVMSSCASNHHHKHKKLKPGKPIPCPLKDC